MTKKEKIKPMKKYTPNEVRSIAIENAQKYFQMDEQIKELGSKFLPDYFAGKGDLREANKRISELSRALSLESGHFLAESVHESHQGLAFQMKRGLEKEFDCKNSSEKALVDLIVSSYLSKLHYTKLLRLNQKDANNNYNGYRNCLSKEIDRAHRQFTSGMEILKLMKQPKMKVNVKTNNAFISEKQQFNNNVKNNEPK